MVTTARAGLAQIQDHGLGASFAAFPGELAASWIHSGTARTQTGTVILIATHWCCMGWLNSLCHTLAPKGFNNGQFQKQHVAQG